VNSRETRDKFLEKERKKVYTKKKREREEKKN